MFSYTPLSTSISGNSPLYSSLSYTPQATVNNQAKGWGLHYAWHLHSSLSYTSQATVNSQAKGWGLHYAWQMRMLHHAYLMIYSLWSAMHELSLLLN